MHDGSYRDDLSEEDVNAYREAVVALRQAGAKLDAESAAAQWLLGTAQQIVNFLHRPAPQTPKADADFAEQQERAARWNAISSAERDRMALEALGDDRLTVAELWPRFQALLPADCGGYESYMNTILKRLMKAGEVTRDR